MTAVGATMGRGAGETAQQLSRALNTQRGMLEQGSDYTTTSGTLIFPDAVTNITFNIGIRQPHVAAPTIIDNPLSQLAGSPDK